MSCMFKMLSASQNNITFGEGGGERGGTHWKLVQLRRGINLFAAPTYFFKIYLSIYSSHFCEPLTFYYYHFIVSHAIIMLLFPMVLFLI